MRNSRDFRTNWPLRRVRFAPWAFVGLIWVATAPGCALDEPTGATEQAVVGDHGWPDQISHYGYTGLSGFSARKLGVILPGIKASKVAQLEADLTTIRATFGASPCTVASACLKVVDENGNVVSSNTDDSRREDATWALAALSSLSPSSPLVLIVPTTTTGAKAATAISTAVGATLALNAAAFGYTLPAADPAQTTIDTTLGAHTAFVLAGPAGGLTSTRVVQVGASTYTGAGTDTVWVGSPGNGDVMSVAKGIPGTFDGLAVSSFDSMPAAVAMIIARLANQPTNVATRAVLNAAAASHFTSVPSGSKVFKDGLTL